MKRKKLIACLLVLFLLAPVSAHASGIPVLDILAWAQRFYAQDQRAEQVTAAIRQVELILRQLQSYGHGGSWSELSGLLAQINTLMNHADATEDLGYLTTRVLENFHETFPPPDFAVFTPEDYEHRQRRIQDTFRLLLESLTLLTYNNTGSQLRLQEMINYSLASDSPLEEAEVGNMLATLQTTELQKSLQAQMLTANAVVVSAAAEVQERIAATDARNRWIASSSPPPVGFDPSIGGYTGLPTTVSLDWGFRP